jgi:hypothetical protein
MGQVSTAATDNVLTASYSETLNAPSTPTATSKLGTITVTWDGLDSAAALPVPGVLYIEFHESTTSGFTPSSSTLVESVPITNGGNYIVRTGRLFDGTTFYYYKTRFVRQISPTELVTSAASTQSTGLKVVGVTGPDVVANSITTNNLEAGFVTAELVRGSSIIAQTIGSTRRVEIKSSGITAYPFASPTAYSFNLESDTGNVSITGGTLKTTDGARGIEMSPTGLIAKNISGANTFVIDADTGNVSINGGSLTITSGLAGYIPTGGAAADINGPGGSTTTIDGGKITTGSIEADVISANAISAYMFAGREIRLSAQSDNSNPKISLNKDRIAAFKLNGTTSFRLTKDGDFFADDITIDNGTVGGSLTVSGNITTTTGSIQTASSGKRVALDGSTDSLRFFGADGNEKGEISAGTTTMVLDAPTGITFQAGGSSVLSLNSAGIALATGEKVNSNLPVEGNITSTGSMVADTFVRSGSAAGTLATLHSNGGISSSGGPTPSTGEIQAGALISSGGVVQVSTMGISTTNPIVRWSGGSRVALTVTSSDARIKSDIQPIEEGLSIINQLTPITYDSLVDSSDRRSPGFIAQDVEQVFCNDVGIVGEMDISSLQTNIDLSDGPLKTLNYESFIPYLTKAIQELSAKNDALEARLAELEGNG